jgi:hypothetical protein
MKLDLKKPKLDIKKPVLELKTRQYENRKINPRAVALANRTKT